MITHCLDDMEFNYNSNVDKKIKELSNIFSNKIKELKYDFQLLKVEDLSKIDLLQKVKYIICFKLNELSNLKERYVKDKTNLLKKEEIEYLKTFNDKFRHLKGLIDDYKSVVYEYKVVL